MSAWAEGSRAAREDRLRSAVTREIEDFRAKYEPLTAEEVAWSHAVTDWLPRWRAWADRAPDGTAPPMPSLSTVAVPCAAVPGGELNGGDFEEKHRAWRYLWAKTQGIIQAFLHKQPKATDEERAWADGVANDVGMLLSTRFRELSVEHPGMRRVDDIDGGEMIYALLGLGDHDDDEFDDDDLDEEEASPDARPS